MELPEKMDSKFRYVLVTARRAEQIVRGAQTKIDGGPRKSTRMAMAEVDRGLVDWAYKVPASVVDATTGADEVEE